MATAKGRRGAGALRRAEMGDEGGQAPSVGRADALPAEDGKPVARPKPRKRGAPRAAEALPPAPGLLRAAALGMLEAGELGRGAPAKAARGVPVPPRRAATAPRIPLPRLGTPLMRRAGLAGAVLALWVVGGCGGGVSGSVGQACLASGREGASRALCSCVQGVAAQTLSRADQDRVARFMGNPELAERMRADDGRAAEAFWDRYQAFADAAEASCPAA